jgi:hypothetical protein
MLFFLIDPLVVLKTIKAVMASKFTATGRRKL